MRVLGIVMSVVLIFLGWVALRTRSSCGANGNGSVMVSLSLLKLADFENTLL